MIERRQDDWGYIEGEEWPRAKRAATHRRLGQGVVVSRVVARLSSDRRPPAITRWPGQ